MRAMADVPDAPWIRDAEINGDPAPDPVICPVCYRECERIYYYKGDRDALGCENCIDWMDAYDWDEQRGGENG